MQDYCSYCNDATVIQTSLGSILFAKRNDRHSRYEADHEDATMFWMACITSPSIAACPCNTDIGELIQISTLSWNHTLDVERP